MTPKSITEILSEMRTYSRVRAKAGPSKIAAWADAIEAQMREPVAFTTEHELKALPLTKPGYARAMFPGSFASFDGQRAHIPLFTLPPSCDALADVAKALRQHLALFCGPDDAVAQELFNRADDVIAAHRRKG